MNAKEIADKADMIVSGYAFFQKDDYVEVIDLNDLNKRAVIQNDEVIESLMEDSEDDVVLEYYKRNYPILKEALYA